MPIWINCLIEVYFQFSRCRNFGIQLPDASCSSVSGVCEKRLSGLFPGSVERGESFFIHADLATNFQSSSYHIPELKRETLYRPKVGCDIFSHAAVTTCSTAREDPVLVDERDCKSIYLRFTEDLYTLHAKSLCRLDVEGTQFVFIKGVVQAHHWFAVLSLYKTFPRGSPYSVRRGIRRQELRIIFFCSREFP
ncbi:hypothetical protein SDC9_136893 [bioreactor metagenome]|uniref:Uncharacterized protein n=1 Tax=bioreactor metagenome TaxID=1076179 RepID=A0A645DKK4_9ZZZZ